MKAIIKKTSVIDAIDVNMNCIVSNPLETLRVLNSYLADITKNNAKINEITPTVVVSRSTNPWIIDTTISDKNIVITISKENIVLINA